MMRLRVALAAAIVVIGSVIFAAPAYAAGSCGTSDRLCLYVNANYLSFWAQYTPPTYVNPGSTIHNAGISSLRNRTNCFAHLLDLNSLEFVIPPNSETNLSQYGWNDRMAGFYFSNVASGYSQCNG